MTQLMPPAPPPTTTPGKTPTKTRRKPSDKATDKTPGKAPRPSQRQTSRCFVTVHWPHPIRDDLPWDIYFKTADKDRAAAELKPGDQVLFFVVEKIDNKTRKSVRRLTGVGRETAKEDALLTLGGSTRFVATVCAKHAIPAPLAADHPRYVYTGEELKNDHDWGVRVVCTKHRRTRNCSLAELKERLKLTGNPHNWHGLIQVPEAAFEKLIEEIAH